MFIECNNDFDLQCYVIPTLTIAAIQRYFKFECKYVLLSYKLYK